MKKFLVLFALIFMFIFSGCTNNSVKSYYLTDDFILVEVYEDGKEIKLGNFNKELIEKIKNIKIKDDYYVINNIKTNIKARKITGYYIDDNLNLIVEYSDGYQEPIGLVDSKVFSTIKKIDISERGNYIINDFETNIQASVCIKDIIVEEDIIYAIGYDGSKIKAGKVDDFIVENIKTIEINEDGYYVINGIVSTIKAYDVYYISFNTDAGPVNAQKIKNGELIKEPIITRKNYYIAYWTYEGNPWNFETDVPTCDMTLCAVWKEKSKLTYQFNLEELDDISSYVDKGEIINEPSFNYPGYDIHYSVDFPFTIGDESITVEVTLTPKIYNIYLNTDKGNLKQNVIEITYKDSFKLPILHENGYDFLGWYENDIKVNDYTFNRDCDMTFEAKWKVNENNYIYKFGSYPQSHVGDEHLISELNKIKETNELGYVTYEGNQYIKISANPINETSIHYSDGTLAKREDAWFKVEPIEWRQLKRNDKSKLLVPVYILDTMMFDQSLSTYSNSFLRNYLNSTFLNSVFTVDEQNMIIEHAYKHSEFVEKDLTIAISISGLKDKINTFSIIDDLLLNQAADEERVKYVLESKPLSDYAIAKYAKIGYSYVYNNRINYGCWWTRDQCQSNTNKYLCAYYTYNDELKESSSNKVGIGIYPYIWVQN